MCFLLTEDVEIGLEVDDVVVETAGESIVNTITVVFAFAGDVIRSLDKAAGTEFDLYTTV